MKRTIVAVAAVVVMAATSMQAGLVQDLGRKLGQTAGQVQTEIRKQAPNLTCEAEKAISHTQDAVEDFGLAAKRGYRDATR